jgi:prevent-host-death family protein
MKTVGIRNLKNSLSQYINMVKSGEKILITDHNRIVAEIIPSTGEKIQSDLLEKYLTEQSEKGSLLLSYGKLKIEKRGGKKKYNMKKLSEIYEETRRERL